MPDAQLQLHPAFHRRRFLQGEAADGRPLHGREIEFVGLVVGVGRLAELLGGVGMHHSRLEPGLGKRVLDRMVIPAGPLDGDQAIAQVVLDERGPDLGDHGRQLDAVMLDLGRRHEHTAVEIGERPFGPGLGTIDANDAEMLRPDLLDPRMNDAARLLQKLAGSRPGLLGRTFGHHEDYLQKRQLGHPKSLSWTVLYYYLSFSALTEKIFMRPAPAFRFRLGERSAGR